MKQLKYSNDEITVICRPELCQNSRVCCKEMPEVFNQKPERWDDANGISTESIIEQIKKCPAGALSFFYNSDIDANDL